MRIAAVTVAGLIQVRKTAAVRSGVQIIERIIMRGRVHQDVVAILQESSSWAIYTIEYGDRDTAVMRNYSCVFASSCINRLEQLRDFQIFCDFSRFMTI